MIDLAIAATRKQPKNHSASQVEVQGTIDRVVFQNESNGYCVLHVRPNGSSSDLDGTITAVGSIPAIRAGDQYVLKGRWKEHLRFGRQLQVQEYELLLPATKQGVIRYLAGVAYGVGPKTAERIVDALGEDCLQRIQEQPGCLRELGFINEKQAEQIVKHLRENQVQAELASLICGEGITPNLVGKIYAKWGANCIERLKENPYQLADELWGVGFKTADRVAQALGIEPTSPFRLQAAVKYVLLGATGQGHCYLRPRDIVPAVNELLGNDVDTTAIAAACEALQESGHLVREGDAIYHSSLHRAETRLARYLYYILQQKIPATSMLDDQIEAQERVLQIRFAPEQVEAIRTALTEPLSVITGGPGTGKSTIINAICNIHSKTWPRELLYLAAPTGRAAKRITETSGRDAQTIHRLLKYSPVEGGFQYNEDRPLPGPGLLIIDEFSMCDIRLAEDLFAAIPNNIRVVLVGDVDQLPSVGPGSVLRDLISSNQVPTTRLRFNYRQAGGSKIAEYANGITAGQVPPLTNAGDFEWLEVETPAEAARVCGQLVKQALDSGLGIMDVQVLAPMYRGDAGIKKLNEIVREIYNPASPDSKRVGQFRLRDKVMVIKNDYNLGVFNGDIGQVIDVHKGVLTVEFDDAEHIQFGHDDLPLLSLAYATSVHKAQGSEFDLVIMVLLRHHYIMLQRNLLYTGMTRARRRLVLIGHEWAVKQAVRNNRVENRYTCLRERIVRMMEGAA